MGDRHMEPRHLIRILRRRWRLLVVLAVAGAALGSASAVMASDAAPPPPPVVRYDACHTLLVDTSVPDIVETWDVSNLAQLAERVTLGAIPESVAASQGLDVDEVVSRVRVRVRNDVESLTLCAVGETPGEAEGLADAFAAALIDFLEQEAAAFQQERLTAVSARIDDGQACVDEMRSRLDELLAADPGADTLVLEQRLAECRLQLTAANADLIDYQSAGVPVVPLESLDSAEAREIGEAEYEARRRAGAAGTNIEIGIGDEEPVSFGGGGGSAAPSLPDGPVARGVLGLVAGLALGLAGVVGLDRLDSRLRHKEEVEQILDLPVLAEIPPLSRRDRRAARILAFEEPRSRAAESYRALRSALDYARLVDEEAGRVSGGAQVVLVTSSGPGEGKTTTVANLAAVMAEGGRRVLAVNCDFRRPRLHRFLGGMSVPQRVNPTPVPGVFLVTQVTRSDADATPSEVVAAQRRVVERAREHYDVVLLDTAPALTTNDAAEILGVVDHVVVVVAAGRTGVEPAGRVVELLERRGRPPLGVVLVGARDVPNSAEYYYDDDDPYLEPVRRRSRRRRRRSGDGPTAGPPGRAGEHAHVAGG